jgi:hypothetical protein
VIPVAFGVHPMSDASQIALNRAFARVYQPLGAVFSVFIRAQSLNPGDNRSVLKSATMMHVGPSVLYGLMSNLTSGNVPTSRRKHPAHLVWHMRQACASTSSRMGEGTWEPGKPAMSGNLILGPGQKQETGLAKFRDPAGLSNFISRSTCESVAALSSYTVGAGMDSPALSVTTHGRKYRGP